MSNWKYKSVSEEKDLGQRSRLGCVFKRQAIAAIITGYKNTIKQAEQYKAFHIDGYKEKGAKRRQHWRCTCSTLSFHWHVLSGLGVHACTFHSASYFISHPTALPFGFWPPCLCAFKHLLSPRDPLHPTTHFQLAIQKTAGFSSSFLSDNFCSRFVWFCVFPTSLWVENWVQTCVLLFTGYVALHKYLNFTEF